MTTAALPDLVLRSCALAGTDTGAPVDITIANGVIVSIEPSAAASIRPPIDATRVIDVGGRVVSRAFAEPHLHLDKALLGGPPGGSTLAGAIAHTAERKRGFTIDDVRARAERVLLDALRSGTTAVRAQTEVDPTVGLLGIDVMEQLAIEHDDWLDLQIAVFPQEGILSRPGTLPLMRDALARAHTVVGGCPYSEADVEDARAHVDVVLDLALEFDTFADLHLDLADDTTDPRFALAEYVAEATTARGLQGRVALGHVTTLAALDTARRGRVLDALAAADVAVIVLPATDLYLMGRDDESHVRRGVAPIEDLWRHGVRTAVSSNNVRNAFTPTGRTDALDMALLLARVSFISSDEGFARLLDMVTGEARSILGLDPRGVAPGASADLVVLDAFDPGGVVIDQPDRWLVLSRGREVYSSRRNEVWGVRGQPRP